MEYTESLTKNHEFRRLYSKGKSTATPPVVVYCRRNGRNVNRIGFTVSKKLGKAVVRNRTRRRLREIYRLHEPEFSRGYDVVFVARTAAVQAPYAFLERQTLAACKKLGLLRQEEER